MGMVSEEDQYSFGGDFALLRKGNKNLAEALEPMEVARMTPEEQTKHALLKKQKAEYAAMKK